MPYLYWDCLDRLLKSLNGSPVDREADVVDTKATSVAEYIDTSITVNRKADVTRILAANEVGGRVIPVNKPIKVHCTVLLDSMKIIY